MVWLVLLSLLASASSTETDAASDVKTVQTQSRGVNMTFFVNTLNQVVSSLPVDANKPDSGLNSEFFNAQIQEITAILNKTSPTGDVKKALDKISALQEYVKTEFELLNIEGALLKDKFEDVNRSVSSLGRYTAERLSRVASHLSDIKISLQKTEDHLKQLDLRLDRMHGINMKLASQIEHGRDVISNPNAYVVHVRNISDYDTEQHACLLELTGFGIEDPGWSCKSPSIRVNGRPLDIQGSFIKEPTTETPCRGVHFITLNLNDRSCTLGMNKSFDTYGKDTAGKAFDATLKELPTGTGIAVVGNDEFTLNLDPAVETLKSEFGVHLMLANDGKSPWFRSAVAWFAVKGDPSRAKVKQIQRKKGPAKLTLDWLEGTFTPWGKGFIKYPRTRFVGDKFTMVTAPTVGAQDCISRCAVSRGCKTVNVLDEGAQRSCQMFTARGGYSTVSLQTDENSSMFELSHIP